MTEQEILDKLAEIGFTPQAYHQNEEFPFPEDLEFKYSEEVDKAATRKTEVTEEFRNHPAYQDFGKRKSDPTWDEVCEKYRNTPSATAQQRKEILEFHGLGDFEEVESYGGEGKGDNYYKVIYFPKHDVYLRADGWYASYEGGNMDDAEWRPVKRTEKTIVVYE